MKFLQGEVRRLNAALKDATNRLVRRQHADLAGRVGRVGQVGRSPGGRGGVPGVDGIAVSGTEGGAVEWATTAEHRRREAKLEETAHHQEVEQRAIKEKVRRGRAGRRRGGEGESGRDREWR